MTERPHPSVPRRRDRVFPNELYRYPDVGLMTNLSLEALNCPDLFAAHGVPNRVSNRLWLNMHGFSPALPVVALPSRLITPDVMEDSIRFNNSVIEGLGLPITDQVVVRTANPHHTDGRNPMFLFDRSDLAQMCVGGEPNRVISTAEYYDWLQNHPETWVMVHADNLALQQQCIHVRAQYDLSNPFDSRVSAADVDRVRGKLTLATAAARTRIRVGIGMPHARSLDGETGFGPKGCTGFDITEGRLFKPIGDTPDRSARALFEAYMEAGIHDEVYESILRLHKLGLSTGTLEGRRYPTHPGLNLIEVLETGPEDRFVDPAIRKQTRIFDAALARYREAHK